MKVLGFHMHVVVGIVVKCSVNLTLNYLFYLLGFSVVKSVNVPEVDVLCVNHQERPTH